MAETEEWKREQWGALYKILLIVVGGSVMLFDVVRVWQQPFDYRWLVLAFRSQVQRLHPRKRPCASEAFQ